MTQYKSIREWIAEGVNPVGYMDPNGKVVELVVFEDDSCRATVGTNSRASLDHHVMPQYGDGDLLTAFMHSSTKTEEEGLRSMILERMKQKGPSRREVAAALNVYLARKYKADTSDSWFSPDWEKDARTSFLSMFPEADQ